MRRILLLVPKGNGPGNGRQWNRAWPERLEEVVRRGLWKLVTPGVLVLAALAEGLAYEVELVDEEFQQVDESVSYDIVAMYTVTPNVRRAYFWAGHFREKGSHVVLGGVHAAMCQEEAACHADTLLIGEAEYIWVEFLKDFEKGRAKGKYLQCLGTVDVDKSPVPAFHLLPQNGRRLIPVQTARGCPHGCRFCNLRNIYGRGYRPKRTEGVVMELEAVRRVNPKAAIYFTDDNFFNDKARSKELLANVHDFGYTWYANTDISLSQDPALIRQAYESGCRQVLIGFESVNPDSLIGIDENKFKSGNFSLYSDAIERIQSCGIGVIGSFILGLDEDDGSIFEATADFIKKTNLYGANITVNTPYPGTLSFDEMKEQNRILSYDWDQYTIFQPVIRPKNMSFEELDKGYIKLLEEIHSYGNTIARLEYFKEQFKRRKGY